MVPGSARGLSVAEAEVWPRSSATPCCSKRRGGGGKGMRRVPRGRSLGRLCCAAERSAARLQCAEVYIEKLIEKPRHIEIQLIGDQHGNMVHLGERECSLQRRHQKVVEECPSPLVRRPGMRREMGEAAIRAPRAPRAITTPARWSSWWTPTRTSTFWK